MWLLRHLVKYLNEMVLGHRLRLYWTFRVQKGWPAVAKRMSHSIWLWADSHLLHDGSLVTIIAERNEWVLMNDGVL